MEPSSPVDDARAAGPPRPAAGVLAELSTLVECAREALASVVDLFALEIRRAGLAALWMLVGGLVAALCIGTAWAGLMTALAMFAVAVGLQPIAAAILVAIINLVAGAALIFWCVAMSRRLLFTATRRQLAGSAMINAPAP